jgi:hypothetical protein
VSLCVALTLALVAAGAGSAATVKLGWTEQLKRDPATAMTFAVTSLTTTTTGWAAEVAITNHGDSPVTMGRSQFGIAEFQTKADFTKPSRILRATTFLPVVPAKLAPGQVWQGTIGGVGVPNQRLYVRLVFGPFATKASPTPFTWITDHVQHVFTISI